MAQADGKPAGPKQNNRQDGQTAAPRSGRPATPAQSRPAVARPAATAGPVAGVAGRRQPPAAPALSAPQAGPAQGKAAVAPGQGRPPAGRFAAPASLPTPPRAVPARLVPAQPVPGQPAPGQPALQPGQGGAYLPVGQQAPGAVGVPAAQAASPTQAMPPSQGAAQPRAVPPARPTAPVTAAPRPQNTQPKSAPRQPQGAQQPRQSPPAAAPAAPAATAAPAAAQQATQPPAGGQQQSLSQFRGQGAPQQVYPVQQASAPAAPAAAGQSSQGGTTVLELRRAIDKARPSSDDIRHRGGGLRRSLPKAVGDLLYTLGFGFEYHLTQLSRKVRNVAVFVWQLLVWAAVGTVKWAGRLFMALGRDIAAPFVRYRKKLLQLQRARERALKRAEDTQQDKAKTFRDMRVRSAMALVAHIGGRLLPVGAAAMLAFTVYGVLNVKYTLEVKVEGNLLGYVADPGVVESAKSLLRDRIRLAEDQDITDWQLNPVYSLSYNQENTTTQQLVNEILLSTFDETTDLVPATGLYIDNSLVAVTTEGERLEGFLQGLLNAQKSEEEPEAVVSFVRTVECNPQSDEVFFGSSVVEYDDLVRRLSSNVTEQVNHIATGEETLADIAHTRNITVDDLRERNPDMAAEGDDFTPEPGAVFVIANAQPYLQVQKSIRRSSVEEVPYNSTEQPNNEKPMNYRRVIQDGQPGSQEVWDDYYYVDGELMRIERLGELTTVLTEPVDEVIEVGTFSFGDDMTPTEYNPVYFWPVPDSVWSSRGMIGRYHRGQDINADFGTPIYASNAGVVEEAGVHHSYGNYIIILHPDGLRTLYGHCETLAVEVGDQVLQKQYIAAVGSTGYSTGPHCHFEIQTEDGGLIDPLTMVTPPEGYSFGRRPVSAGY